ncbi:GreA/GreB family elongation factor [Vibrio algivorus]|uniref:Transcription elongation factor n=1 Tax=Vibrio algivorus TaxID=1667024 RepID=A0A557P298_9VIBR|nr:GreA/GreB family elongation factor [Vibrio algivorus]TVO34805.1 transcription elongation factor [Vibrio algivorus]
MNKEDLHQAIIKALIDIHDVAHQATQTAISTATDKQNIPEHKYDTLSLEAAYLAHGQAQRVNQCLQDIQAFKALPIKSLSHQDPIHLGALVELYEEQTDINKWFFVSPVAGGLMLDFEGQTIRMITLDSPLGKVLKNKRLGDEFELNIAGKERGYEVVALF